ncbi:hypothetical protein HUJ05_010058 [Dendroctonus ponderosae]|nr:hypothetical protein HUJ05_010058 [Dendroctonus ponderosae]
MPQEVVTADDEGLHIFTKSPCHAFFGEVLGYLRRARGDETPKMIIRKSLKVLIRFGPALEDEKNVSSFAFSICVFETPAL